MTYEELTQVAKKQGLVRWEPSGIIEYLRIAAEGVMLARRFKASATHRIHQRELDEYHCVEITREDALRFRAAEQGTAA